MKTPETAATASTAQLTLKYIDDHPHIKRCLVGGLINYSALSRLIAKEIKRDKLSSLAAVTVASQRYRRVLKKRMTLEREVRDLLSRSALEVRNRIAVARLSNAVSTQAVLEAEARIRTAGGTVYAIHGTSHWTVIYEDRFDKLLIPISKYVERTTKRLALLIIKSDQDIETTPGVCSYLTSLFAENGVNIHEFLSCWTDTLFVVRHEDVARAMDFLHFE